MLEREGAETPADVCLVGNEDSVSEQLENLASAGATDFAAVEVGTNPEEKQRTRALLKKAAASERKMQ